MEDDFLDGSASMFGEEEEDTGVVHYGPLILTTAPKEGKANTLLADHLFSPSLLLAERMERSLIPLEGKTVIELGAGCALPSLLSSTLDRPPSLVVVTDYPDETILGNLKRNVERNRDHISPACTIHYSGYEWGQNVGDLLKLLPRPDGYDVVILSDLLHFDRSHDVLMSSLTSLLAKSPGARTYVAAGKYTHAPVCDNFIRVALAAGIVLEEGAEDDRWRGTLPVAGSGLDREHLGIRKGMCRWWTGRWTDTALGGGAP